VHVEGRPTLGRQVPTKYGKGVIVGVTHEQSAGVKALKKMPLNSRKALYNKAINSSAGKSRAAVLEELAGVNLTSQHAKELRAAMKSAKGPLKVRFRPGQHAHHLVPSTHRLGQRARDVLERVGIHFNEAMNGLAIGGKRHARLHTKEAIESINLVMEEAEKRGIQASKGLAKAQAEKVIKAEVENALSDLRQSIKAGTFP